MTSPMTVLETLLQERHSCRAFREEAVAEATIRRILAAAQRAPSWCNIQPWQVVLTSGDVTKRLAVCLEDFVRNGAGAPDIAFPPRYEGAHRQRRRECGFQLYDSLGIDASDKAASSKQAAENFRFFGAPHLAIITTDPGLGTYGVLDCGLYICAFVLAAQALGVACIPQAAIARCAPAIHKELQIPDEQHIVCGISFGWEDVNHPANKFRTSRAALDEVVQWRS